MEILFLLIGCAVGLAFAIVNGRLFYFSLSKDRWEKVVGHVHDVVVEEYKKLAGKKAWYHGRVDYVYDYRSITRRGYDFVGQSSFDRDDVQRYLDGYWPGQAIDVYVYKKNPSESTLVPGIKYGSLLLFLFGSGFVAFCMFRLLRLI